MQLIRYYCKDYKIKINYKITPEFQNNKGDTVAMWLTKKYNMVPKYWMHDYSIKNKEGKTLKDLMIDHYMPIP